MEQPLSTNWWIIFLLLHVPMVMAMKASSAVATIHALATFTTAFFFLRSRSPQHILYVMGYIIASEPLWRVHRAAIFYESAKYMVAGLSILAIFRFRLIQRADKNAAFYMLVLLPSLLVLPDFDRRQISFNLSGPFSLAMGTLFASTQRLTANSLQRIFLCTLGPILGLVVISTFFTLTTEISNFYYSKVASGGLGQNQASSIFGLGLLIAFFYMLIDRRNRQLRWLIAIIGIWCGTQSVLTFSRGGLATTIGAIAAAGFFLLRDRKARGEFVLRLAALAILAIFVIIPQLNTFTGGAFAERFTSSHLTGRDKIIKADILAFQENPIFGVGPGKSKDYHALTFGRRASSHTEYSRLIAEHGTFGIFALALLGWMSLTRLKTRAPPAGTAIAIGFTVWALLYMFHAAMRMAAVSFIFSLGAAYLMVGTSQPGGVRVRGRRRRKTSQGISRVTRCARSSDSDP